MHIRRTDTTRPVVGEKTKTFDHNNYNIQGNKGSSSNSGEAKQKSVSIVFSKGQ